MRTLILPLFLLALLSACDSNDRSPELLIEVISPDEQIVLKRGEVFDLKLSIISDLDLRDLDLIYSSEVMWGNLQIKQGVALTHFAVDTTLVLPQDNVEPGEGILSVMSPSGTGNRLTIIQIRVE
ncbi:MAG: hypothetical protein KTR29_21930 [Rhodothermaceae bacterium]|nr:hypothetical protein [Rhodothermaceae bacterium]